MEIVKSQKGFGGFGKGRLARQTGSHKVLERENFEDYVFAFHDRDEIGSVMLSKIAKKTGLKPEDL